MVENTEDIQGVGDNSLDQSENSKFNFKDNKYFINYYETPFKVIIKLFSSVTIFFAAFLKDQGDTEESEKKMSRRAKPSSPLSLVSVLKSIRDQIGILQDKRGVTPDENNFITLLSVIVQQAGSAMYAVFTMFMALLPVGAIIIHTIHFMLDRLLDVLTTKKKKDLWFKGSVFILQLLFLYIVIHYVFAAIFAPIFAMQTTIVSKILLMDDNQGRQINVCKGKEFTFQDVIVVKPIITPILPPMSPKDVIRRLLSLKTLVVTMIMFSMALTGLVDIRDTLELEQPLTCVSVIDSILDQVTVYQLGRGVPRENYSYMTLMSAMMTMVGRAVHAVLSLMLALAPITEISLHVIRFTLEKFSEIFRTTNKQELMVKIAIFAVQLMTALFMVSFVFGTIMCPVFLMGVAVLSKLLYMVTGRAIVS